MDVTIYGIGYVGLVTGVCLADLGNQIVCVDIDQKKIDQLKMGHCPIYEPNLQQLLWHNLQAGRLHFTTDFEKGASHGLCQFIAVGTPPTSNGSADLDGVYSVASMIGRLMKKYCVVINKSTVPVGTADQVQAIIQQELTNRQSPLTFDIASNPEFLREGAAVQDFMNPDRIIVGADSTQAQSFLRQLYTPMIDSGKRFVVMDTRSSELTKYASNAFLATKISFINELSRLAERLDADIEQVRLGMTMDPRIGEHFLYPGCGYGGSCFPKDIEALQTTARDHGLSLKIISAAQNVNEEQKFILIRKMEAHFGEDLAGKTIALWGLAFKPNTDDMREASSSVLIEELLARGVIVQAFDPAAQHEAKQLFRDQPGFLIGDSQDSVLEGADALVIVTEWDTFRSPNYQLIKEKLSNALIFDGRNLFDPSRMKELGFQYYAIGRGLRQQQEAPNNLTLETAAI